MRRCELTAAQQHYLLRATAAVGGRGQLKRDRLRWEFCARPSPMSREYRLVLEYTMWDVPRVIVVSPDLRELARGRKLPHVYSECPILLCLYLPRTGEWHRGLSLAATVVPWAYLWLYYFEEWLLTDEWTGGGVHPGEES